MAVAVEHQSISQAVEIFRTLSGAVKTFLLYSESHPRFKQSSVDLARLVREYSDENSGHEGVAFLFKAGRVYLGKLLLPDIGVSGKWLERVLRSSGFEGLLVKSDLRAEEVGAFVQVIASARQNRNRRGTAPPASETGPKFWLFSADQARSLMAGRSVDTGSESEFCLPDLQISRDSCYSIVTTYRSVLAGVKEGRGFDYSSLLQSTTQVASMIAEEGPAALPSLSQSYFDEFTFHHSVNVAAITTLVASRLVTDTQALSRVSLAALLHDSGKNHIPADILHKPAKLTPAERKVMETHSSLGARMLLEMAGVDPLCVLVAFGHHLYDGPSAYPKTLRPYRCDWLTKLISVVDVYEALTAVRPYKPGFSSRKAFEIMLSMPGLKSKLPIVKLLYDYLGPYPLGSIVELNTGERAEVIETNKSRPFHPKVRVLTDRASNPLDEPTEVDLAQPQEGGTAGHKRPWIRRSVVCQKATEDPLTAEFQEEPTAILGGDLNDDEALMAREG